MPYKVYIVDGSPNYYNMFTRAGWEIVLDMHQADLVQFTGGADVSPLLYGEQRHPTTHNDPLRDDRECKIFNMAVARNKMIAGICRGGQFLNVMNGGKMWQNINNHAIHGTHVALDMMSGRLKRVSSTHHQMMIPKDGAEIVAISHICTRKESDLVSVVPDDNDPDIEVVFYKDTNSLCFQPHPEFGGGNNDCTEYYFELLSRYLNFKVV